MKENKPSLSKYHNPEGKATANVTGSLYVQLIDLNFERIKRWAKRSEHLKNKLILRSFWKIEVSIGSHQCQMQGTAHGIKTCPFLPKANGIDYIFHLVMQPAIDRHTDAILSLHFNQFWFSCMQLYPTWELHV